MLNRSSIHWAVISLNSFSAKLVFISLILSRQKLSFHLPNTLFSLKTSYPLGFRPRLSISPLVCSLNPSFFMHFTHLDLGFGFSLNFGIFENWWVFCELFGLGFVYLILYDHALHSICIFTIFHAFRCVFICSKLCANRFGLGWTHDAIFFCISHVHAFFMHMYHFFFLSFSTLLWWCFSVCLLLPFSLSLG